MPLSSPSIAIILLNWNGWQDTIECVESCRTLSYPNYRILLVDNGSTDDSEAILRERFPDIEFIQTGANLGFAGGNNVGIRHALAQGADYVWLLNNDTVVDTGALSALVQMAEGDNQVGMVGSKIVYHGNPHMIWYAGAVLDSERPYRPHHRGLNEDDRGQYDETCPTGYITGCSLLARREMMAAVGLLDEDLFLYFEDVDWSARARAAGWKLMYCPESLVYHKVSLSVGGAASPTLLYYTARNRLYFVKRNFPDKSMGAFLYDVYEHVLVNVKKGRFACAWGAVRGISDYLCGRSGARPEPPGT
jgi:GT2 family glycosyltransferase